MKVLNGSQPSAIEVNDLEDVLSDELISCGFGKDDEPTAYGLELENLIGKLTDYRIHVVGPTMINQLFSTLDEYEADKVSIEDVEACTGDLIASDSLALFSDSIQEEIYVLDMYDINEFDRKDILETRNKLKKLWAEEQK